MDVTALQSQISIRGDISFAFEKTRTHYSLRFSVRVGHFNCSTPGSKIGHHGAVRRKQREATILTGGHFASWKKKGTRQSSYQKGSP